LEKIISLKYAPLQISKVVIKSKTKENKLKKIICIMLVVSLLLAGCSSDKVIEGRKYTTYGLLNQDKNKDEKITYELSWGNVIWGCILIETFVAPIYFFGFDIFQPKGKK
jgi:hypothetical protein